MKTRYIIALASVVVIALYLIYGFYEPKPDLRDMGPLDYKINETLINVTLGGELFEADETYFKSLALECGKEPTDEHLTQLKSVFSGIQKYVYQFEYLPDNQGQSSFIVSVLRNKLGYTSLEEFKKDFDQCFAGGNMYPTNLNNEWLMFVNSCGSGFSDGSELPIGCVEAKNLIIPTLGLDN